MVTLIKKLLEEHKDLILPVAVALSNHYMEGETGEKIVNDHFPTGAVKIASSILDAEYFKIKSNYADAEDGTYMFLKERETPAAAKDTKTKAGSAAATPKPEEQEAKDMEDLKAHIIGNQFDWIKDGTKKNGDF